ncbi:MAG TPA: OmpA family protein [Polyangiaceae bacterium]|nr:OmpA family protein [Polyangiaceae bacterium]
MNSRLFVGASILLVACGTNMPPRELVDARAAYEKVKTGEAAQLKPEVVHEAKVALDQAEASFADDATSDRTRDLSYVAQRKAEYAAAQGGLAGAVAQRDQATRDLQMLQAQGLQKAQGELSQTRQQLAATGEKLEMEKKARQEAEKRARDAIDKLAVAAATVKEEPRGTVITLPGAVLFPTGKWDLLPGAREKLDQVAEALKNQADHKMVVEGHTDSQGSEGSNQELSQRRAQTVRDYFVSRGVPSDIISATGVGQHRPVGDNRTADGRANNRRVEIIVQPVEKR